VPCAVDGTNTRGHEWRLQSPGVKLLACVHNRQTDPKTFAYACIQENQQRAEVRAVFGTD
jgi:hypothetical protein